MKRAKAAPHKEMSQVAHERALSNAPPPAVSNSFTSV